MQQLLSGLYLVYGIDYGPRKTFLARQKKCIQCCNPFPQQYTSLEQKRGRFIRDTLCATTTSKTGHRSKLAFLRFCVIAATGRCKHTQVELLWITWRIQTISAFPINSKRLDTSVFTSMLPEIGRKSRTCATRATGVIFERKHCSR